MDQRYVKGKSRIVIRNQIHYKVKMHPLVKGLYGEEVVSDNVASPLPGLGNIYAVHLDSRYLVGKCAQSRWFGSSSEGDVFDRIAKA